MALKDLVRKGKPPHRRRSLMPQHVSETTWFYDDKKGLLVVHEFRGARNEYLRTDQFIIPWRRLHAALVRNNKI